MNVFLIILLIIVIIIIIIIIITKLFSSTSSGELITSNIPTSSSFDQYIINLYNTYLNRAPNDSELSTLNIGPTKEDIKNNFLKITNYLSNLSNDDFITAMYKIILRREPDNGGFTHYQTMLKTNSREWMLNDFHNSKEYKALTPETFDYPNFYKTYKPCIHD